MIDFTVPGTARGKGRPRFRSVKTKGGKQFTQTYTDDKTATYELTIALCASQAMRGRAAIAGPMTVRMEISVQPPVSWSKKKKAEALGGLLLFPTSKPDVDNVIKAIMDACNGVIWVDDSQVCTLSVTKRYAIDEGVFVRVWEDMA